MKITMKSMIYVATVAVFTLAFGIAYADDAFNPYVSPGTSIGEGSAAAAIRNNDHSIDQVLFAGTKDTGTELYKDYVMNEAAVAKGSAAGGVRVKAIDPAFVSPSWDSMPTMFPQR
jgi:hypothetical protein